MTRRQSYVLDIISAIDLVRILREQETMTLSQALGIEQYLNPIISLSSLSQMALLKLMVTLTLLKKH